MISHRAAARGPAVKEAINRVCAMITSIQHTVRLAIVLVTGFATPGTVFADPAYTASDIVAHFAPKNNLGGTRALCIGTETECAKAVKIVPESTKPVDGFNLRINFDYNSAHLTPAARTNLNEFARALKDPQLNGSRFIVEGHTDGMGSDAFNLNLSERRASAVVDFLAVQGITGARLEAKGYGKQKPLVADPMASENRRVETRLLEQ